MRAWDFHEGSSPHTRGTPRSGGNAAQGRRDHPRIRGEHRAGFLGPRGEAGIIPAYAGNTALWRSTFSWRRGSSPHTRGTPRPNGCRSRLRGDHPRIRGEHKERCAPALRRHGIIPAYAGNTALERLVALHPQGSSPHTRGTPVALLKTICYAWDHPRIRGEHPRVRAVVGVLDGIIPAYAGNTAPASMITNYQVGSSPHTRGTLRCSLGASPAREDHPRIRGEHLLRQGEKQRLPRIIPAYAGNTRTARRSRVPLRGSSPHTRGTPRRSPTW